MNKLFTKIAGLSLGLAMAIGVGVAVGSKEAKSVSAVDQLAYTISLKDSGNASDGTAAKTALADIVSSGNSYVSSVSASYVYQGKLNCGVKLGSGNYAGVLILTLSSSGQVKASKVVYEIAPANDTGKTIKLSLNGQTSGTGYKTYTTGSTSGSFDNVELAWDGATTLTSIKIDTTAKKYRTYLKSIKVYTAASSVDVTGVSVSPTAASIGVGGTQQLTPTITPNNATDKAVTYSSNATGVATVSSTGLITAVAAGNATITVTTHDGGFTATCAVTVTAPVSVTGVTLNKNSTSIDVGETETLTATVAPNDATDKAVTWSTSAPGVATVSNGVVTAVAAGSATITVTTHDGGYTATCAVTVKAPSTITFIGGTDKGDVQNSITKGGITISVPTTSDGTFIRDDNFRVYSGKVVTFTSTVGNIQKVDFTCTSDGYNTLTGTNYVKSSDKGTWTGDAASFSLTADGGQSRITKIVVTLASNDPLVELTVDSATSVSMLKGDPDSSVKVHVLNIESKTWTFTFDEDEEEGLSTSSYISVSAGAAVSDVHTLTITTKGIGSTTLHISVSGTACATSIPVTVAAKPNLLRVVQNRAANPLVDITSIELQNGGSARQFAKTNIYVEDTDKNPIEIGTISDYVTLSRISGDDCISISGGEITGTSVGTAVVKFELKSLTSVYDTVTVSVIDDHNDTVNSITFNSSLTATQGDSVDASEVFATRVANTYFGSTENIADSEFLYSYSNNRSGAEAYNVFSYDFSGTTVDPTHKEQTIYVFVTFDEEYSGSFSITVEQKNDPLTAITITNVVNNEKEMARGTSFQLEIAYTPTNPTDGKEVVYRVDECDEGVSISVNATGLISVSSTSGLGAALIIVESAHDDTIYDWVDVSVVLESMTYNVDEPESWSVASSISVGDRIVIAGAHSDVNYELTGVSSNIGQAASFTSDPAGTFVLTVGEGNAENSFTFSNGTAYLAYTSSATSGSNYLYTLTNRSTEDQLNQTSWTVSISDGLATITNVYNTNRKILLNYNNGSPRFCAYTSSPSSTMHLPSIYKVTGGITPYDVDETLFNGVHNNFGGEGATYQWSESCPSFNSAAWLSACNSLKDITGYSTYKLNRAVGNIAGNEIEQFIAKYDIIIGKFGDGNDWLGRFAEGGINHSVKIGNNPLQASAKSTGTVIAIVIISTLSIAAVGGYFLFRKKKEN